ncbi:acyltransferase family protein [Mesorhizobium qingshengii]|uniref:Peptidoglycan/LPS O-acetylase OafA/YrhL, contains acyltransferase and SGNH-hydrolase domains n=1 Tax=Mesorhizobium qingshengii TaxID=1165689 RepID=A0A1G5UZI7_9HYPH|nr:acyltransferase [Mesorhizobium qingshengii]SDA39014.1 Peptidoglycan/LPS O-acetylase OafA/YrhL, contains acyltransferase and SGNH-hydrolase domains [Mesorhizobium qingshengii]
MPNNEQRRYLGLQALRAIAALLVVVQHSVYFSCLATGADTISFRRLQLGTTGVFIFFVISGAVMALATTNEGPRSFALSRLTRIYPAYFLALGLAYVVLSTAGQPPTITPDASLFLLPTGDLNSTFNVPYWTLIYEMQFYALLWLAVVCRTSHTARMWLAVCWAVVILVSGTSGIAVPVLNPTAIQIPFSGVNLFFVLGYVMASGMMTRDWRPFFALVLLTSVMSLYANAWSQSYLGLGVLCASAVFISIWIEAGFVPKWLAKAGDYSYGLYLAHLSIVFAIYKAAPGWPLWAMIVATLSCGLLGGLAFGRLEQWLYRKYWRPIAKRANRDREFSAPDLAAIRSDQR